ncbi:hypothetical protein [Nonomuraea typhae]|uniref:hypothetical protein n=1 Tax=Nonomuraea typhae TaxID=2603600 RepID=UPI0012F8CDE5|nr:hypothetical protein [Nonomuraea typhae]
MSRGWPSRVEWAAAAEHAVRTACYPMERVPEGAEHYLTSDEVGEMDRLYVELSKAVRAPLTAEIKRLQGVLPWPPPAKPIDRSRWYDALTPACQAAWQKLQELRNARLEIGRRANGHTHKLITWLRSPLDYSVLSPAAAPFVPDQEALGRLADLEAKYARLRQQAADDALAAAIQREIAKRNSDEGWAKELEHRARIDGNHVTAPSLPQGDTPNV